jgi:hypothetical protein
VLIKLPDRFPGKRHLFLIGAKKDELRDGRILTRREVNGKINQPGVLLLLVNQLKAPELREHHHAATVPMLDIKAQFEIAISSTLLGLSTNVKLFDE